MINVPHSKEHCLINSHVLVDTSDTADAPDQPIPMSYVYTPYIDKRGYVVAVHTAHRQTLLHFDKDLNYVRTLRHSVMPLLPS